MNLANKLTVLRILLVPVFIVLMAIDSFWTNVAALVVFCVASITDFFDGQIARKYNTVTTFGIFLDPLADKLLVASAFISFIDIPSLSIPAWMVICIIAREFMITGLRSIAASKGVIIPANTSGKIKTTAQMITIIFILAVLVASAAIVSCFNTSVTTLANGTTMQKFLACIITKSPYYLMFITTIITIYSGIVYILNNKNLLSNTEEKK